MLFYINIGAAQANDGVYIVSTFLFYMNTDRKINTVEHGLVRGLAVASAASFKTSDNAKDYADITEGDHIIGCTSDGIKWKAVINEVIDATDDEEDSPGRGEPVRILKGNLIARGARSIAAASKRMKENGIDMPAIFNSRGSGFKQGSLAKKLTDEQAQELETAFS